MSVGVTSDTIDAPQASQVAIFEGRDESGQRCFLVEARTETGVIEFAIKDSDALAYATVAFASASARDLSIKSVRIRELLETVNQDIDIEEAGDDQLIGYVTDAQAAAERLA